jgi:hypothetical protein
MFSLVRDFVSSDPLRRADARYRVLASCGVAVLVADRRSLDEVLAEFEDPAVTRTCEVLDAWDALIAEGVPGADSEIVAVHLAEMFQMDIAEVLEITAVAGACRSN